MNGICLNRGININDKILDSANAKIGQVKVIGPDYLLVGVRLRRIRRAYWIRYLDCRHISGIGDGQVNLSVTGSEALSKTKPDKRRTIEQLLKSESIPVGTYIHGSDGEFISRVDALRPGEIVFYSGGAVWTAKADQIESYDPDKKKLILSRPLTDFLPERS